MTRPSLLLALVVGLVVGIVSTWWFTRRADEGLPADSITAAPVSEKKVLYWYDPMVPSQRFDQPGKSPFMDMQLVPKYAASDGDAEGSVAIDSRLVQNLGVRTARAQRGTLNPTIRATGTIAFDERAVSLVQARAAGIVEKLVVRTPMAAVTRGQPLLTLIAADWTAAQAEYLALRQSHSTGLDTLRDAARRRLTLLGMSEGQIRDIERSERAQERITVTAPASGVVSDLLVRDGASVTSGTPLMRINGLDSVWINAAIPESQIGLVIAGAKVGMELPAFPGESIEGTVEALLPTLDTVTRTQTARIVVANPTHRLVPGMFARLQITPRASVTDVILVPTEAVIATGLRHVVMIDAGDGRFRAQEIRIGEEADGQTVVLQGIREGESVVLSGQFLIDSEASLSGTLARLDGNAATSRDIPPAAEQHSAEGTVQTIDGRTWTIATKAIPSLQMDAMTMMFVQPDSATASDIEPGQRVRFSFVRNADGDFEITTLRRDGDTP